MIVPCNVEMVRVSKRLNLTPGFQADDHLSLFLNIIRKTNGSVHIFLYFLVFKSASMCCTSTQKEKQVTFFAERKMTCSSSLCKRLTNDRFSLFKNRSAFFLGGFFF